MNLNIQQIFASYIEKFQEINVQHEETYKWKVVKDFQKCMDIALKSDDESFADALYEAKKASENIIDSFTQPFYGLVEFARKEPAVVRQMFTDLYSDDGGDLKKQEKLIEDFFAKSNALLDKYFPGSYRFKQNSHSVSAYLFLYRPDTHYMYKATQANIFADCIGFYEDWGSGDNIKLAPFYRMCDELVEAIKADDALLKTDASRFDGRFKIKPEELYEDKEKHLLAFDIIYCSSVYDVYKGMSFNRPKTKEKQLYAENKKKAQELLDKYNSALEEQKELNNAIEVIINELKPGNTLNHKKFGKGKVISVTEDRLTADFPTPHGTKELGLIPSIANQIITFSDISQEKIEPLLAVLRRKDAINSSVSYAKKELESYAEYLD